MAVAFWASSCTFCTSAFGSSVLSAPASTSLVGRGPAAVPPVCAPQHPEPRPLLLRSPAGPYLLPPPGRPCRRAGTAATPSWLGREQSARCGAAGGPRGCRHRPRPHPSTTLSRDVPAHLCRALWRGGSPGLALYTLPTAALGGLRKGQGRARGGCRGAPSGQELGNPAGRSLLGPRVSVCAYLCMRVRGHTRVRSQPGARGRGQPWGRGHTRHKGDIQRPCPRARRPRAPRGSSDLATAAACLVPAPARPALCPP